MLVLLLSSMTFAGATGSNTGAAMTTAFQASDENTSESAAPDEPASPSTEAEGEATPATESASAGPGLDLTLKASGTNAVFAAEREFSKQLSDAASLKKKARTAARPLQNIQREIQVLEIRMQQAQSQLVGLNAQLANVTDVATNNRLVGTINALQGQLELADKNLAGMKAAENQARIELNSAREAFVESVLGLRRTADAIEAAYKSAADDAKLQAQLSELNAESGKTLTLQSSGSFASSIRKLVELEASIHTERIPLRRDGNTFYASVVINGKHTAEMVVDSGASLISLPLKMAVEFGLEPKPEDRPILITIADGSTITGHLKTIPSVRVGTFTLENVECAVLGADAVNAEPLLGMSYLGQFQFQLDAAEGTLGMTEIGDGNASEDRKKK
jgi:aspartyl protease family protein